MDDGRFEQMLMRLLQADFSSGTEAFRDELLARCLAILGSDAHGEAAGPDADRCAAELDDADLELLAAAGDPEAVAGRAFRADNGLDG